jgi:RHS repeat-associated protein
MAGSTQIPSGVPYDASGNITNDGLNSYLYDGEGRICAVRQQIPGVGSAMTQYLYDADGNRVAKGTISTWSCDTTANGFTAQSAYVLGPDGGQLTEMTNAAASGQAPAWQWAHTNVEAGGLSATYDADPTGKTAGPLYFHLSDWLGTRRQQTDYAGNPVLNFTGLPFGDGLGTIPVSNTDAADATEHHFTGKERDGESGNDHFGARYYASTMGRFMSPDWSAKEDPVPYAVLDDPQSLNLYSYVRNNPLNHGDPDGHECPTCQKVLSWLGVSHRNTNSANTQTATQGPLTVTASAGTIQYTPTIPSTSNAAVGAQVSASGASVSMKEGSNGTTDVKALTANAGANAGVSLGGEEGLGASASGSAGAYVLSGTQTLTATVAGVGITASATGNAGIGISGSASLDTATGFSLSNSETFGAGGGWSISVNWAGLTASGGASEQIQAQR